MSTGSWERVGNIRGPTGPNGPPGVVAIYVQADEPQDAPDGSLWITEDPMPSAIGTFSWGRLIGRVDGS